MAGSVHGSLTTTVADRAALGPALAQVGPSEVLLTEALAADPDIAAPAEDMGAVVATLGPASFDSAGAERRLTRRLGVATLDAFGAFTRAEMAAMGALLDYVAMTQGAERGAPRSADPRAATAGAADHHAHRRRDPAQSGTDA